jgi:hypothetical protein
MITRKPILALTFLIATVSAVWAHGGGESRRTPARSTTAPATTAVTNEGRTGSYRLTVTSHREQRPNEPIHFALELTRSGRAVTNLAIVHTKPMHLIAVSEDLGHFLHLHPELHGAGKLDVDVTFPEGGHWSFFADFTESGMPNTVVRVPVGVGIESRPHPHRLEVTPSITVDAQTGTIVKVSHDEHGLFPGDEHGLYSGENVLTFSLTDDNGPVTDMQEVLGAMGHLVVIREGAATADAYVHAHPAEHEQHGMDDMAGMDSDRDDSPGVVAFHVDFPKAGRYKAWAEFNRGGRKVLVSYVFNVMTARPAPASRPAREISNVYSCPMHPEVRQSTPGACPKCGMYLQRRDT